MALTSRLQIMTTRGGLYETHDFRGESADGRYAFILKHVTFRPLWRGNGLVEVALMCFDRVSGSRQCVVERESMTELHHRQLKKIADWEHFTFSFGSGSFVEVSRNRLRGKLHSAEAAAVWDLRLQRPEQSAGNFGYELPWPKHGIRVSDGNLAGEGRLAAGKLALTGSFALTNTHYWGNGYPHEFAAGQCSHFDGESGAGFYGFNTRLSLGRLKSPYLGMACLKLRGRRYAFDSLAGSFRHRLESLDNYRWRVTFLNAEYGLEVLVDGQNPRITPWMAWHADHPSGGRSVVKVTPFAQAELVLFRRRNQERVAVLKTGSMELKTLLPENVPESAGFVAVA